MTVVDEKHGDVISLEHSDAKAQYVANTNADDARPSLREWAPTVYCLAHGPSLLRGCFLCSFFVQLPYLVFRSVTNHCYNSFVPQRGNVEACVMLWLYFVFVVLMAFVWVGTTLLLLPVWFVATLVSAIVELLLFVAYHLSCHYCGSTAGPRWRVCGISGWQGDWQPGYDPHTSLLVRSWSPFPTVTSLCYGDPNAAV